MTDWIFPTAFPGWFYGDSGAEHQAIDRVLHLGQLTMGPEVVALEEKFASYHNRRHGIACNSGSSANWLAFAALYHKRENPIQTYDAVMLPGIAWATTWAPALQHNLHAYVADVDDTWNCPPPSLPTNTRLVVTCPVLGNPAYPIDYSEAGVYQISDCCESLGARVDGKLVGTWGDLATFSGYFSHQINGIELGVILTDDDELAGLCRMLRDHGWDRATRQKGFDHEYSFILPGMNLRPLELHAAVAQAQLAKLDASIAARVNNLLDFYEKTENIPIAPQRMIGQASPFGISFCVEDNATRLRLATALRAAGVDCRLPTGGSATRHPMMAYLREANPTPNADRIHDTGMFLGCAPWPIPHLIDRAVQVMKEVL